MFRRFLRFIFGRGFCLHDWTEWKAPPDKHVSPKGRISPAYQERWCMDCGLTVRREIKR